MWRNLNPYARLLIVSLAIAAGVALLTVGLRISSTSKADGNVAVVKALGSAPNQAAAKLKLTADTRPATSGTHQSNGLACALQQDGTVALITGTFSASGSVSITSQFNGMGCIWDGPNGPVSADILSAVQIGNASALENAYQANLRFSRSWAHKSPTLGESITELPGHVSAYRITDTATHSLAVVTVDPALGLVVRYTAVHDTPSNRNILERWAA